MRKGKNFISGGVFSIFLTIGFILLVVPGLNKRIVKTQKMYSVNSSTFTKIINFPQLGDYIIKIKYNFKNTDTDVAILNGEKLELRISNNRDIIRTRYYYAPKDIVKSGENFLRIHFYPSNPPNIDLRIRNYLASTAGENIVITLKNSAIRKTGFVSVLVIGVFFFIFSIGLWILWGYLGKLLNLPINQVLSNNILSFLPWTGIYFIFGIISVSTPYSLAVSPLYLFGLLFFGTLVFNAFLNLLTLNFLVKRKSLFGPEAKRYEIPIWLDKAFSWIKLREFSDKCVLFFMFLLIMCAFLLILGMEWLAEQFANVAYFALVLGVVIKFVKFVKEKS